MEYSLLEKKLDYAFKDKSLLERALTLSSFDGQNNNQGLECLGDALLTFIVAEKFYLQGLNEGEITQKKRQLLSDEALAPVSVKLGLDLALRRGNGDVKNKKAIPSAYEAVIAAIYLDGGLEAAKRFAQSTLPFDAKEAPDYISALQEILQSRGEKPPTYLKFERGTPQAPEFVAKVTVGGKIFSGTAGSWKEARKVAAESAFDYIINKNGKK